MSNNEQEHSSDDEYRFVEDLTEAGPEAVDEYTTSPPPVASDDEARAPGQSTSNDFKLKAESIQNFFNENSTARKVIIAAVLLLLVVVLYKIIGGLISGHKKVEQTAVTAPIPVSVKQSAIVTPAVMPVTITTPPPISSDVKQKLTNIEQTQSNLQSQVQVINDQTTAFNSNLNTLSTKVNQLSQQVAQLASAIQAQSELMVMLKEKLKKPRPVRPLIMNPIPSIKYYLQAVIPGRAWLIATNGNTLTVRVGSPIPGYGVVKQIDAIQGRVSTSTGQLIRFSQDDS